jgi:two-component system sensor histidine kinase/response regulator
MRQFQSQLNGGARLLVVDDQPANIRAIGELLGKLGYEIIPALDGEQALKRLGAGRPDLILLDVLMEGLDGFEVCRRIRSNPEWADIPIIFLSAADDKEFTVRAFDAGGVDYVTKPFNRAELVSRVRTHLALKLARDRMRQLAEDKDELLGILAHDCHNHVGGIQMTAQLIRDRAQASGDARLQQLAASIDQATSLMLTFMREFLANAAADYDLATEPQSFCLKESVAAVAQRHREAAHRKQLTLRLELMDGDVPVKGVSASMDQVLDNLLSNAIKFSPPGRTIVIGIRHAGADIECYVQDQGPGFSAEDKALMFRRYTRLSARPTGGEPSTGLGLSIVKKLVEAMGGKVTCESTLGEGTTFFVRLPQAASNP